MSDMLQEPRRQGSRSSHDAVVEGLGRAMVSGTYPPGSILPRDDELETTYKVSRTVLREAMKTLAAKGMILPRARVGTTVRDRRYWTMFDGQLLDWHLSARPSSEFFEALFQIRHAFEPFAAALSAERASAEAVTRMHAHVQRMRDAGTELEFAQADLDLHREILTATGNPFFDSVAALIEAGLLTVLRLSSPTANPARRASVTDRHQDIVDAIAARDADAARTAMTDVIDTGLDRISSALVARP